MSDMDLSKFEKKIVLRNIEEKDLDEIIELSKLSFPNMKPWTKEQLKSHLKHFQEGQFCIEYEEKIIGSCSSLIIDFDEYDVQHTWDEITDKGYIRNHDPKGSNLYGIEVMVHPEYRRMKIGRRLYDARKDLAVRFNLKSIVIGGRIPNYHKHSDEMTPREYVEEVRAQNIYDPVLTFQIMNGFVLKRINNNYLKDDFNSMKYATLMEWSNIDYKPMSKRIYKTSFPVRVFVVQYMMKQINSFHDFAHQCEYYVDISSDYKSDFIVFPEIFTTQLLSFIEEK